MKSIDEQPLFSKRSFLGKNSDFQNFFRETSDEYTVAKNWLFN
jgi:hypothetical protein